MKTCTSNDKNQHEGITRQDVYTRVTDRIVADLEQGVRTWVKPWNAEHAAGKIIRPLRHNGIPYSGINILMLWRAAMAGGFAAPIWMTFKQALELNAHVRKGEKGSLVIYANSITRKETDDVSGDETEREIHFMKGYTVFNVEQIEGLPTHYYAKPEPRLVPYSGSNMRKAFSPICGPISAMAGRKPIMRKNPITSACRTLRLFVMRRATTSPWHTRRRTGPSTHRASPVNSGERNGATKAMPKKSSWPKWDQPFCAPIWSWL